MEGATNTMAMLTCEVCGTRFVRGVGKPPRTCPEHRGTKLPPRTKAATGTAHIPTATTAVEELPSEPTVTNDGFLRRAREDFKTNRYDGKCYRCGGAVSAEQGRLYKTSADEPAKPVHLSCLAMRLRELSGTPSPIASEPSNIGTVDTGTSTAVTDHAAPLLKGGNPDEAMAAIQQLMATITPSIDEDGVRAIVNDAIATATSEDRIKAMVRAAGVMKHELTINNEPVDLPTTHHFLLPDIVKRLAVGIPGKRLNLFLPGPAGSGKSTVIEQAAKALDLPFSSMSLGPTTPTHKFFGYQDANGRDIDTPFHRIFCAEHGTGGVFLIDEMDNGHPGLTAELNQALANPTAAFAWGNCPKHPEFRCAATGNTFGTGADRLYVGRNKLDAATLDRFVIKEFPIDETMETRAAMAFATADNEEVVSRYVSLVQQVRKSVSEARMQIVVSPRASIDGAMMLSGGIPMGEVIEERLIPGMIEDTRKALGIDIRAMVQA